jgi:hypothetical protein
MAAAVTHRGGVKLVLQWASSDVVNFYTGSIRWELTKGSPCGGEVQTAVHNVGAVASCFGAGVSKL